MKRMIITLFTFAFALHLLPARAETYNLIGQRYLRLYTAPEPTQAYNASIDAQTVADSLCNVKWTRAISSEATSTTHANDQLDSNVSNRDRFDAALFCALHMNGMHTAYANAAVYRYRFPDGVLPRLTRLSAKVSSDPYNALGARIVLYTNATGEIPMDCATCRGEVTGGIKLAGVAPRVTRKVDGKDYWYPNTTNVVFTQSVQLQQYLFVFVLMENYASSRGNWLEGCSWMDNLVSVATDAPIPGWADGQTVDLSGETDDTPADAGIRADSDNDGLTDCRERMASTVLTNLYGTTPVDASKMTTYPGQAVPDYFLPVENGSSGNWTYLGSLLTDHDFIEDWLEDSDELFSGDRMASRYCYDAHADYDDNGWDNWSEARAYLAAGKGIAYNVVTNGSVIISNAYEVSLYTGRPQPKGRIKVVYNGAGAWAGNIVVQSYRYRDGKIPPLTYLPDCTWTLPVNPERSAYYELGSVTNCFMAGGKNMFVVFNDANTDGRWTAGEPYGIVTGVDVGYASIIADSAVELTDVNWSMMRVDLPSAVKTDDFASQNACTDRGVRGMEKYPNTETNNVPKVAYVMTRPLRVRIVRIAIDGISEYYNYKDKRTYYAYQVVLDEYVRMNDIGAVTEWMLARSGELDLDAAQFSGAVSRLSLKMSDVTDASYAVVLGDGALDLTSDVKYNKLRVAFHNAYESGSAQTHAVPLGVSRSDLDGMPTFSWTHSNTIGKEYPSFRLRVYKSSDDSLVYDSGVQKAPAKRSDGVYVWTAPVCVGDKLENGKSYTFSVSMLDAKFTTPNATEKKMAFRVAANGAGGDISDQYSIPTAVKYFGHVSTAEKSIRVEAFASPDFVGIPASVTTVTDHSSLATTNSLAPNALLIGLKADKDYFIRAFVDSNGDGILGDGEPWGYCNYVGTNRRDIYTPRPFSFKKGATDMPKAVVYLEDVDVEPLDLSTVVTED